MTESTLNRAYPSLSTLTSIIVQRATKTMLDKAYAGFGVFSLNDYVEEAFDMHEWEPDATNPREQVMRELKFIGFAW